GPGQEPEIAPVDRVVESRDGLFGGGFVSGLVGAQQFITLGARKEALRVGDLAARRHFAPWAAIGGAIIVDGIFGAAVEIDRNALVLIRHYCRQPIVLGDAKPAARALALFQPLIFADTPAHAITRVLVGV